MSELVKWRVWSEDCDDRGFEASVLFEHFLQSNGSSEAIHISHSLIVCLVVSACYGLKLMTMPTC